MYTFRMNTLLISSAFGIFWLTLLFALCFIGVHVLRLARLGQLYRKQASKTPEKNEEKTDKTTEAAPEKIPEPIYYIVERKKRVKSNFSEPKQIRFK